MGENCVGAEAEIISVLISSPSAKARASGKAFKNTVKVYMTLSAIVNITCHIASVCLVSFHRALVLNVVGDVPDLHLNLSKI